MQEQVNEKTVALYIKTGKLTAEMLQRAMKKLLSQMKKQADRPLHGKQTLKQLMKQNAGVSNIEITGENIKAFESTAKVSYRLCAEKGHNGNPAPLSCVFQRTGRGRADRSFSRIFRKEADAGQKALYPKAAV